jgi:hypothetical protein
MSTTSVLSPFIARPSSPILLGELINAVRGDVQPTIPALAAPSCQLAFGKKFVDITGRDSKARSGLF